jgi:uncharacterized LabA/DUF88 family protein
VRFIFTDELRKFADELHDLADHIENDRKKENT